MPGLESMRRRLSSIAKSAASQTTPPSHTHPDTRLLDPAFFNISVLDLSWFHKLNLAVCRDTANLRLANDYMHTQRVVVSAHRLYQADASQPWARDIDTRTIVVAAMVASLGAPKYARDCAENERDFGPRRAKSPEAVQCVESDLLFGFLRRLDCPPDVAGPAALVASMVCFEREVENREKVAEHCEAYPALRFVQDAVRLDELGWVGIARLAAAVGVGAEKNDKTILEMVHLMDTRLMHYVGLMKTKGGRKEAERRWAQMLEFREGLLGQTDCSAGLQVD